MEADIQQIRSSFGNKPVRAIIRYVVGTDEWKRVMAELGYGDRVISLPPVSSEEGGEPNSFLKKVVAGRWKLLAGVEELEWPEIGGKRVHLLAALTMRTALADVPKAKWDSREGLVFKEITKEVPEVPPFLSASGVEGSILPYDDPYR
jgi:hypothetical protein